MEPPLDRATGERLDAWRASTVGAMLTWQLVLALPSAIGLTAAYFRQPDYRGVLVTGWALVGVLLALALARRLSWRIRAVGLISVLLGMVILAGASLRPGPIGFTHGLAAVAVAGLLLGGRAALATALAVLAIVLVIAAGASNLQGLVELPPLPRAQEWIAALSGVFGPFVIVLIGVRRLLDRLSASLLATVGALGDLERTRQRLAATEKAELVGRLAGAVAHDLNNTLTVILAHADALQASAREGNPAAELGHEIRESAQSAARLARQLLMVGRRELSRPRPVDLSAAAAETARIVRRVLPHDIQLDVRTGPPVFTLVDPVQLQQAILNLALNARDAMPSGGTLRIETRPEPAAAGTAAVLEVADNGVGMDEETRRRAFEPFFTTKEPGKGTGLGLASVKHVVDEAGGEIVLRTTPGRGTTFTLAFPAMAAPGGEEKPHPAAASPVRARVLVVDDDIRVRALLVTTLLEAGHAVEEAGHVSGALRLLEEGKAFDLLVTDLVMPGRPVAQLLLAFRGRFPGAPVLACSAYADDPDVRRRVHAGELQLLAKPFGRADLLGAVQEALSPARPRPSTSGPLIGPHARG